MHKLDINKEALEKNCIEKILETTGLYHACIIKLG